ncbi:Transmembrane protein 245, partial [Fragariocoptes setiger]
MARVFSQFVNDNFSNHPWMIMSMTMAHLLLVALLPWSRRTKNYLKLSSLFVSTAVCVQILSFNVTLGFLVLCFAIIMIFIGILTYNSGPESYESNRIIPRITPAKGSNKVSVVGEAPTRSPEPSPVSVPITPGKVPLPPIFQDTATTVALKNRVSRNFSQLIQSFLSNSLQEYDGNSSQRRLIDCSNDEEAAQSIQKHPSEVDLNKPISSSTPIQRRPNTLNIPNARMFNTSNDLKLSSVYLYGLIWVFVIAQFWLHPGILYAVGPFILSLFLISWSFNKLHARLTSRQRASQKLIIWLEERQDTIIHPGLRHLYRYLVAGDRIIINMMQGYVDGVCVCMVMVVIFVMLCSICLYLSFQIYTESVFLLEHISQLVNSTMVNNPDLKQLFPDGLTVINSLLDGAVNNTYRHGREWIKTSTRQLLDNAAMENFNKTQSKLIEKQVVEFWDRAYVLFASGRVNGSLFDTQSHNNSVPYDWNRLFDAFSTLNFSLCMKIVKQNLDTLMNITDSILLVVRSNINLVLQFGTAALSIVLVGGNALVNFFINLIIFTTALFYLLCASHEHYKPYELISNVMPTSSSNIALARIRGQTDSRPPSTITDSINAVFVASFKMMAFHGLFTWLLHRVFDFHNVVYIPSVISAIFGAVPFLSPYWASMPAVIDLWLCGQRVQSILMFLLSITVSSFVTTAFYSEIKGVGHPYLTGLALAGGVFVFGIEGVLLGPILLVLIRLLSLTVFHFVQYK